MLQRIPALLAALAVASSLGSCEPRQSSARAVAEILTREGATFIVVEPQAYYLRLCDAGEFPLGGDPDGTGMRAVVAGADARKQISTSGEEIAWTAIDTVIFSKPEGELSGELGGEFCDGPASILAMVRLKDGTWGNKHLIDTTDRGIEGKSARGEVVIPIRVIARIKMIDDLNWAWAAKSGDDADNSEVHVGITRSTGAVQDAINPETALGYEKRVGDRALSTPVEDKSGFPAVTGGARILIPWDTLRSVEIHVVNSERPLAAGDAPLAAHLVFADGHSEDVGVRNCDVDHVPIDDIRRIDVTAKRRVTPK